MKLFGIILVFIGCSLCGLVIDGHEKKRLKELEKFIYIFELLKAEIDYMLTPLKEASLCVAEHATREIKEVLRDFARQMEDKESVDIDAMWKGALKSQRANFHLGEADYELLYSFGSACGYLDKEMQKKNIEMLIYKLQEELTTARHKYQKNTKLNKYLGILIGACISIFLI